MVSQRQNGSVDFSYFRPDAQTVDMVGSVSPSPNKRYPMTRDDEGWWRLSLSIQQAGDFIYKYQVDGQTHTAAPIRNNEEWFRVYPLLPLENRDA